MSTFASNDAVSLELLEAAARWYVQLNDPAVNAQERKAWQTWLDQDVRHRQAWSRMQALENRLGSVPRDIAVPALNTVIEKRRRTLQVLTLLVSCGTVGMVGMAARESTSFKAVVADHRTRTGERRQVRLADGGTLDINTASSVDVEYTQRLRLLRLHAGEILIQTAQDPAGRPFEVRTSQGRILALGTKFSVRSDSDSTRVAVFEHAVELYPADGAAPVRIEAGQQAEFTVVSVGERVGLAAGDGAWTQGKLVAIDRRLEDFLAELSRYRPGRLACDPAVADLRLSGAFRLGDTDAVLENLTASLPVRVSYATRYWVRVEAK